MMNRKMTNDFLTRADVGPDFDEQFGQLLIDRGKLDMTSLQRAERAAKTGAEPLHHLLPKLGLVSEKDVADGLAEALSLEMATAADYPDLPVHEGGLSANFLKASRIVPLNDADNTLTVAMADPLDEYAINALRLYAGKIILIKVGIPADIDAALDRLFGQSTTVGDLVEEAEGLEGSDALDDIERLRDLASEAPVVRIVNRLIVQAVEQRASDIH
ncbi:MAG: type II secretion system protein GspE, partial [Geminicoccaceae bacterium]